MKNQLTSILISHIPQKNKDIEEEKEDSEDNEQSENNESEEGEEAEDVDWDELDYQQSFDDDEEEEVDDDDFIEINTKKGIKQNKANKNRRKK